MSEQAYEAPTLAGRALCDLGQQLATMRAERAEAAEADMRHAWEAGFRLAVSYNDNHVHFEGWQKERQWLAYLANRKP